MVVWEEVLAFLLILNFHVHFPECVGKFSISLFSPVYHTAFVPRSHPVLTVWQGNGVHICIELGLVFQLVRNKRDGSSGLASQ
jgi:hypothetical protein